MSMTFARYRELVRGLVRQYVDAQVNTPNQTTAIWASGGARATLTDEGDVWWLRFQSNVPGPQRAASYDARHTPESARITAAGIIGYFDVSYAVDGHLPTFAEAGLRARHSR